ncbi:PREDICTED: trypsin, alkaline C-like [Wasmannia auropunctata]|uniref:trypsin, alkaline C-like n=1 Tax=Wasmannia auropunctata TaxID=64793 RepID=UPI0005F07894|nr:PREDICTED: trypsin, alkaline C-like [Wasmannia auropunctata]
MNSIGITGGNYARIGQFPFMAVISQFLGNMLFRQCDGTIINSRWVLTAGNCIIHGPRPFFVAFGIIDSPNKGYDFLPSPGVSMITTQAFVHPNYRELLDDDIGLLQMPANIPFSSKYI